MTWNDTIYIQYINTIQYDVFQFILKFIPCFLKAPPIRHTQSPHIIWLQILHHPADFFQATE